MTADAGSACNMSGELGSCHAERCQQPAICQVDGIDRSDLLPHSDRGHPASSLTDVAATPIREKMSALFSASGICRLGRRERNPPRGFAPYGRFLQPNLFFFLRKTMTTRAFIPPVIIPPDVGTVWKPRDPITITFDIQSDSCCLPRQSIAIDAQWTTSIISYRPTGGPADDIDMQRMEVDIVGGPSPLSPVDPGQTLAWTRVFDDQV
jgi:hypothetical protein